MDVPVPCVPWHVRISACQRPSETLWPTDRCGCSASVCYCCCGSRSAKRKHGAVLPRPKPVIQPLHGSPSQRAVEYFREAIGIIRNTAGPVFIDLQWIESDCGNVVKEFAVTGHGMPIAWILVKPPEEAVRNWNNYVYSVGRVHGIRWNCGDISAHEFKVLTRELFANDRRVYCGSTSKINILTENLAASRQQITLLDGCLHNDFIKQNTREGYTHSCKFHMHLDWRFQCAMRRVKTVIFDHADW